MAAYERSGCDRDYLTNERIACSSKADFVIVGDASSIRAGMKHNAAVLLIFGPFAASLSTMDISGGSHVVCYKRPILIARRLHTEIACTSFS